MADVFDVADFFIQLANQSEDDQMTNLKLNKLLYYAQGAFLARTGKTLFDQSIEAWQLGPVVPEIYHKYKVCGKDPISSPEDDIFVQHPVPHFKEQMKAPLVSALPSDWYDPEEDAEWEAYL